MTSDAPLLAGIHHVKLPVRDLERSRQWYESRLGYRVAVEFVEQGTLMGVSMRHPNGGPEVALRLDPDRAAAAAGFDYFAIGVPDKASIDALAERLSRLGEEHAGVHFATIGWILPMLHDPDGHEVRFYTMQHHTEVPDQPLRVENPREAAAAREAAMTAELASAQQPQDR
jgi:catechol 2,3-dioxygenase-like lactoylglutathione lyase family enzyme